METSTTLSPSEAEELGEWLMKVALPKKLSKVKTTTRLVSSPAVVTDHESASLRRMMRMLNQVRGRRRGSDSSQCLCRFISPWNRVPYVCFRVCAPIVACLCAQNARDVNSPKAEDHMIPRQTLEINPSHPVIVHLNSLRHDNEQYATVIAEQVWRSHCWCAGVECVRPRADSTPLHVRRARVCVRVCACVCACVRVRVCTAGVRAYVRAYTPVCDCVLRGTLTVATVVPMQLFDNALVAAGLMDDPRSMLPRLTKLLELLSNPARPVDAATVASVKEATVLPSPPNDPEAEEKNVTDFMHDAFSDEVMSKAKKPTTA